MTDQLNHLVPGGDSLKSGRDPTGLDQNLLDALTDHVCVLSEDGKIIAVNRPWREFATANSPLATNADVGSNYFALCETAAGEHADTARVALQGLRKVARGELPEFTLEYECHSPDTERWFELRATLKQGNPRYVVAIHRNITRRRQAERQSRASEERYRAVVEDQTEVICRFKADGTFLFVNDVYCRFFGKPARELIGQKWQPVAVSDDLPHIEERLRTLALSNPVIVIENRVYAVDGQVHWMQFVNRGFFDPQGRLTEIQSVGRDITDRKRAEEALQKSEARLSLALAASHTGVWEWNVKTNAVFWSPECLEIVGKRDYRGRVEDFTEMLHPDDVQWVQAAIEQALVERKSFSADFRIIRPDGVVRWLSNLARAEYDGAGQPLRMIGTVRDISERKQAGAELARSREVLRALAARMQSDREDSRKRIAREIHDEFGHAMTDLKLDLAWLDRRLAEKGFASRCVVRSRIAQMSRRVDGHAQSVRRIATELRPPVLDALGLSAAIEWQAREFEQRSGVSCQLVVTQESLALDSAQATALFRAFQEILSNITRHAQATRAEVVLAREAGRVTLRVSDNGHGFEPTRSVRTTALGLLGMQERAAALGGTVHVESARGQGTVVTVTLPVQLP